MGKDKKQKKTALDYFMKGADFSKDLKPLKQANNKQFRFMVADIETSKWVNFVCVGLYGGREFSYYEDYKPFFDAIIQWGRDNASDGTNLEWREKEVDQIVEKDGKHCVHKTKRMILDIPVFVHNGGRFDFNFFMQYIFKQDDPTLEFVSGIPIGSSILSFRIRKTLSEDRVVEISMWDSTKLLPFSLANLTKSFDVEHKKLEIEYKDIDKVTDELVKYLEHDCKGHYEVMKKFYSWNLIAYAGPKYTMASQALQVFRTYIKYPIQHLDSKVDTFIRKGYFGGRTEVFKPYFNSDKKKISAFDVNSLYPFIMQSSTIYYRDLTRGFKYSNKYFGFWDLEMEVPYMKIPPLPAMVQVNKNKKLIFGWGKIRGVWGTNEIEYALSLGCKVLKTHEGWILKKGGNIFKDFVDDLYKMRLEAKAKGDEVGNILTKLLLNSSYGRFGISPDKEKIIEDPIHEVEGITIKNEIGNVVVGEKVVDGVVRKQEVKLSTQETEYEGFSNVAIAAQVTSHARILMHKYYMKAPDEQYYTDTDSLYTTHQYDSDPNTLGALKFEGEAHRACFILPKTYIFEELKKGKVDKKVRMKGFNTRKDSYDDLRLLDGDIDEMDADELLEERRNQLVDSIESRGRVGKEEALRLSMIKSKNYKQNINEFTIDDFFNYLEGDRRLMALQAPKFGTFKSSLAKGEFVKMMEAGVKSINSTYDKRIVFKNEKGEYDTKPHEIMISETGENIIKMP